MLDRVTGRYRDNGTVAHRRIESASTLASTAIRPACRLRRALHRRHAEHEAFDPGRGPHRGALTGAVFPEGLNPGNRRRARRRGTGRAVPVGRRGCRSPTSAAPTMAVPSPAPVGTSITPPTAMPGATP